MVDTRMTQPVEHVSSLSLTQEFLCMFANGGAETGPFGPRYHGVRGLRLRGEMDLDILRGALDDVVVRHEALRTRIVRDGAPRQEILPHGSPELVVLDLPADDASTRDRRAEELLNELEASELDIHQLPHVRAVLGRFDQQDTVLALLAHHVAIDGWSMQRLMKDIVDAYGARATGRAARPLAPQYRDYTEWQKTDLTEEPVREHNAYWREKLQDAQMLGVATDRQPPDGTARATGVCRFSLDHDLTQVVIQNARRSRSTPFMVLLTAYNVLLARLTGTDDVVVPTITFGRRPAHFEDTVGPFFNFVPLRTNLTGHTHVRDALTETRRTCIEAQAHELPFTHVLPEAPELMSTFADRSLAVGAFQTFQYLDSGVGRSGGLAYSELRQRTISQDVGSDIPDGVLWTLEIDPAGETYGNVRYDTGQFDRNSVEEMVTRFRRVLDEILNTPDAPLRDGS